MADITRSQHQAARLLAASVPQGIAARLSDAEMAARCAEAARLSREAQASADPVLRQAYTRIAKAVISGLPAAEVQARHRELQHEAEQLGPGKQRDAILRQMDELLERNPVEYPVARPEAQARAGAPVYEPGVTGMGSPRRGYQATLPGDKQTSRTVIKAADPPPGGDAAEQAPPPPERLIVCFSQTGQIIGCCHESKLIPVVDPASLGQPPVAKGSAAPKSQRPQSSAPGR